MATKASAAKSKTVHSLSFSEKQFLKKKSRYVFKTADDKKMCQTSYQHFRGHRRRRELKIGSKMRAK